MALSSTLYTGLSGLVVNQTQLNVVGNNIANANTTAFKSSSVQFSPQFYITENNGTPTNTTDGGSNPNQVGLGAQVAAISENFTQGQLQNTGVPSDLAINGSGFFITQAAGSNEQLYTRDGAFGLNSQNQLTDANGDFVQGYGVNSDFQVVNSGLQPVTIPLGQETVAQATQNASLSGTLNAGGVVATQGTVLTSQALQSGSGAGGTAVTSSTDLTSLYNVGGSTPLYNPGDVLSLSPQQNGRALPTQTLQITGSTTVQNLEDFLTGGLGIDTNPPAGTPGTPGVSLVSGGGGTQIVVTGNVGTENAISIPTGGLVDENGASALDLTQTTAANGESAHTSILAYDSLGNPVTLNVNTVLTGQSNGGTTWEFNVSSPDNQGGSPVLSSGTLAFNTSGQLITTTGNTVTLDRNGTGATASQNIDLNFGSVQALSGNSSSLVSTSQDGFPIGTLDSYAVGTDGTITGSFTNGQTETIGQVALATFTNPNGLLNQGGNQFAAGAASGAPVITTPQTGGSGSIQAGSLEQSNVDLSQQFIDLIIASTGYSASSRVISTSDQLLTALLNSQG